MTGGTFSCGVDIVTRYSLHGDMGNPCGTRLDTLVDSKITKYAQSREESPDDLVQYRYHADSRVGKVQDDKSSSQGGSGGASATADSFHARLPINAVQDQPATIKFSGQVNLVPVNMRAARIWALRTQIMIQVRRPEAIVGFPGETIWTQSPAVASRVRFTVPWDDAIITRFDLRLQVINVARLIAWGGGYLLDFD